MIKGSKQRNVIITFILWLTILVNIAMTIGFVASMYATKAMDETLGLGLCSMFTFANVLGAILLLRWNKYGLGLIANSVILISIVYAYVLNLGFIPTFPFIGTVVLLFLILQIRKGGKSAWSQLNSGWDTRHCRHIYQIFVVIELILFILTLIAFGDNKSKQPNSEPTIVLHDTIVIKEQNPEENILRDSILVSPSVKSENSCLKTSNDKSDKDINDNQKSISDKVTSEKSPRKSYSIDDAVWYLDTHDVWNVPEMNQYPDLRNLHRLLKLSLYSYRNRLPSKLTSKSKRLREISMMLEKIEYLSINNNDKDIMLELKKRSHRGMSSNTIEPYIICNSLKKVLKYVCRSERNKPKRDEQCPSQPSNEKQVKRRSIGGNFPVDKDYSDSKAAREKSIQREIDEYKKMVSDSIKNVTPTFGLG